MMTKMQILALLQRADFAVAKLIEEILNVSSHLGPSCVR